MTRPIAVVLLVAALAPVAAQASSACPAPADIESRLRELAPLLRARSTYFAPQAPNDLHFKASQEINRTFTRREQKNVLGVVVVDLPVERLWKAINDEDHFSADERYMPVQASRVVGGTPRGEDRLLFQHSSRMGIGRWWVSRIRMNRELYESTHGALWELGWKEAIDAVDPDKPPIREISSRLQPIRATRGAWLLIPLTAGCTLVENASHSDAGGAVGAIQALIARRTIREVLEGVVLMAREHTPLPHTGLEFVRPDGTVIE